MLALIVLGLSAGCSKTADPDVADALVGTWTYRSTCNPSALNNTGTLTVTKKSATAVVFKSGTASLDVTVSGSTFSGSLVGADGARYILSGSVSGNTMTYAEQLYSPTGALQGSCSNTATK